METAGWKLIMAGAAATVLAVVLGTSPLAEAAAQGSYGGAPAIRQDSCVTARTANLGAVELVSRCRETLDVKWCYMELDGSGGTCVITRSLSGGFRISTPMCYRCTYKVLWQAFRSDARDRSRFGSDASMLEVLRRS